MLAEVADVANGFEGSLLLVSKRNCLFCDVMSNLEGGKRPRAGDHSWRCQFKISEVIKSLEISPMHFAGDDWSLFHSSEYQT